MGTSGLVGQFGTVTVMGWSTGIFISVALLHFAIPATLAGLTAVYMRRAGWIGPGDVSL